MQERGLCQSHATVVLLMCQLVMTRDVIGTVMKHFLDSLLCHNERQKQELQKYLCINKCHRMAKVSIHVFNINI